METGDREVSREFWDYLEGTASMDGAGIDVWVGASGDTRRVAAVILRQHNVGQQRGVLIRRP